MTPMLCCAACLCHEVWCVLDWHEVLQQGVPVVLVRAIPAQAKAKHAQRPQGVVGSRGLSPRLHSQQPTQQLVSQQPASGVAPAGGQPHQDSCAWELAHKHGSCTCSAPLDHHMASLFITPAVHFTVPSLFPSPITKRTLACCPVRNCASRSPAADMVPDVMAAFIGPCQPCSDEHTPAAATMARPAAAAMSPCCDWVVLCA